jgi:hypothetical protein
MIHWGNDKAGEKMKRVAVLLEVSGITIYFGIGKYKDTFLTTETSYGKFFIPPFVPRQARDLGVMKFLDRNRGMFF